MKPLYIEFQAFGPYPGYESVNFDELSQRGLFLICGETGSGKTMLLDAMTFALYGKSSTNVRDDFAALRCSRADFDTDTFVKFTFEASGVKYRFERYLERKRKNLSETFSLCAQDENGIWNPLFENPKKRDLDNKAVEIIGLDYEQFRQVIILPQGQFERLLISGSEEKEKILMNIFGEYKWERIATHLYEDAIARQNELKAKKNVISVRLNEDNCASCKELEELYSSVRDNLKNFDAEYKAKDCEKKIRSYRNVATYIANVEKCQKEYDVRKTALLRYEEAIDAKEELLKKAKEALKAHQDKKNEIEEKNKTIILYESKTDTYKTIDEVVKAVEAKKTAKEDAANKEESEKKKYAREAEEIDGRRAEYERLNAEHGQLLEAYLKSITGEIAKTLTEGKPCPVCGSTLHPNKAMVLEGSITNEEVKSKKAEAEESYDALQTLAARHSQTSARLEELKNATSTCIAKYEKEAARLEQLKDELIPDIKTLDDLEGAILSGKDEIAAYDRCSRKLEDDVNDSKSGLVVAKADYANAKDELKKAGTKLSNAKLEAETEMKKAGYDFDASKLKECLELAENEVTEYNSQRAVLVSNIERIGKKLGEIKSLAKDLDANMQEADADVIFAKKLRGETGIGLQRYVLGIMFSSVIASANKMLEMVHSGRYRLFRSDDKIMGSNKRGLELKVYDKFSDNNDGRFVNTLSGGEKFLVSLALSIGMSTVAQRGGMKIEALFIDEGFGSLDENSIDDAMNILAGIQKSNGMVGIISHVQILQDRIPSKLIVKKAEGRSTITATIG